VKYKLIPSPLRERVRVRVETNSLVQKTFPSLMRAGSFKRGAAFLGYR
jgi:hypothetical protein